MADISYPQIVHDIKEKYIEATGEPDNIKYGEIAQDVYDAITSGGGSNIGYEVKFKVDGNDYYVSQCLQGESITEPPIPTSQTGTFTAWQINGADVSFPYTPSADVELTAHFSTVRTEMEIYDAGTTLWTGKTKDNNGKAICGKTSDDKTLALVGLSANDVAFPYPTRTGSITYDGDTYYYCLYSSSSAVTNPNEAFANVKGAGMYATFASNILDHYFYKD